MKPPSNHRTKIALMAMFACAAVSPAAAETLIETPDGGVDAYYAVASKHFGDGQVQLHARQDGETGSKHSIYSFDCTKQTYAARFEGAVVPERFPLEPHDAEKQPLKKETVVVPLAQHACEQHGHPLLELRW